MNEQPIAVVDYGAGNVQSVVNALRAIGASVRLTSDLDEVLGARGVVVPGVGAARDTMDNLARVGLVEPLNRVLQSEEVPYLGICMGMQALMTYSEEHGGQRCLDVISGNARLLETDLPVPHMGWNSIILTEHGGDHPLFDGIPHGAEFYFAHSFACFPDDRSWILAETEYGGLIPTVLGQGNVMGIQAHPEKSGIYGLQLLRNFVRIVEAGGVKQAWENKLGAAS